MSADILERFTKEFLAGQKPLEPRFWLILRENIRRLYKTEEVKVKPAGPSDDS